MTANIEFSKEEAEALLGIINKAVKASGIEDNTAKNGVYFQDKLAKAFEVKPEVKEEK
jgi:undecaprenyl pyrophosphate synthase